MSPKGWVSNQNTKLEISHITGGSLRLLLLLLSDRAIFEPTPATSSKRE